MFSGRKTYTPSPQSCALPSSLNSSPEFNQIHSYQIDQVEEHQSILDLPKSATNSELGLA